MAACRRVARQPGNGRMVWRVGDERLSRMFGAVDDGYAVCRLLLTAYAGLRRPGRTGEAYDVIHQHGLAADFWDGSEHAAPYVRTLKQLADEYRVFATMRHRYGDRILPMCQANYMFSRCLDSNLSWFDADVQRDGIQHVDAGLGSTGHRSAGVARQLYVFSRHAARCPATRHQGDRFTGAMAELARRRRRQRVADQPVGCADRALLRRRRRLPQSGAGPIDRGPSARHNLQRSHVFHQHAGRPAAVGRSSSVQRPKWAKRRTPTDFKRRSISCWPKHGINASRRFSSSDWKNFCDLPDWDQANTLAVNYLREQAKRKKLVFASGADIADYFTRHYHKQPENWFYWPDTYCGYAVAYKPKQAPDRIELSNGEFHSVHESGASLPRFFWDFTRPWSEPIWDDQAAIRKEFGLCDPKLLTADNCVPRMVNLDGVKATVKTEPTPGGARIRIEIESSKPLRRLPVAAWNIPLQAAGLKAVETSDHARFVGIVDGSTENLHGLVVCENVLPGKSVRKVCLQGASREPVVPTLHIGRHVAGRMFLRNGVPSVYLWRVAEDAPDGTLTISVPAGRKAAVHYNNGKIDEVEGGVLTVRFDRTWFTESPMITGLTQKELASMATFEPAARPTRKP